MAHAHDLNIAEGGIFARLNAGIAKLGLSLARRRLFRQTMRELGALSDRELSDLGISRTMVRSLAYEAAYGK